MINRRRYQTYKFYRALGYTAQEALKVMRESSNFGLSAARAIPLYTRLYDAQIVKNVHGVYVARCYRHFFANGENGNFQYVRRGLTAKGAYRNLFRQIRFDQLSPDFDTYHRALRHGQPSWLEIPA